MKLSDYVVPLFSVGGAIASLVLGYQSGKLKTAADEAEIWLWNIPQLLRPVTAFPLPVPVIAFMAASDIGCCSASGIVHWTKKTTT